MLRAALALACVLGSIGCIKRVAPVAGEARSAASGEPLSFTGPKDLPEGSQVRWEFGDGSPEAAGPEVSHSFPRAGRFTVTQSVVDKDGEKRSATTSVLVKRRGVAAAVPADARAALILERPWARVAVQREAARRAGFGDFFDQTAHDVSAAFGFDAQDPAVVEQNGVDTDEGVALYTVPQDAEALVVCAGISDPIKAEATLRRLLAHPPRGAPFTLRDEALPGGGHVVLGERSGGERVGFLERLGYLYLRTPGPADPMLALVSASKLGLNGGLEQDAGFQAAVAKVGAGDAIFYSPPPRPGRDGEPRGSKLAGQLGAAAFSVQVSEGEVKLALYSQLTQSSSAKATLEALTPRKAPPPLAGKLPAGAAAFFKLSGDPKAIWRELQKALGPDGPALAARLKELFGTDVETGLLPAITGNGAVAVYLDAQSLIEALLGEQVAAFDRSTFLSVGELVAGGEGPLRAALDVASREMGGARQVRGATWWPITEGLQAAIKDGFLYTALGGAVVEAEDAGPAGPGQGGSRSGAPPPGFGAAGGRFLLASASVKSTSPAVKPVAPAPKPQKAGAKAGSKKPPPPPPEPTAQELGPLAAVLLAAPGAPTLEGPLAQTPLPLDVPTAQLAWIDLHGMLERLERAGEAQGGMVGAAVKLLTSRVSGVRDALVDARPIDGGLSATVTLRLLPQAGTGGAKGSAK
jgi:hypothetical protein